jgi:hypothetical protein
MSFGRCWANSSLLAMPVSRGAGPIPCDRHYLSIEGLGNLEAIGSPTLERLWAISSMSFGRCWASSTLLAVPVSGGAGPIPCYRHNQFREGLGQLEATGSPALEQLWAISSMSFGRCWANSMLLAMPVSREAGSIPCYRQGLFRGGLGQLEAIGSSALERPWAIGSMSFGRCWANSMLLAISVSRGAGPILCYRHGPFREGQG